MKNSFVAIAIIIAILISGSIGYVVGTSSTLTTTQARTQIVTETTTQYSTIITTSFDTSGSSGCTNASCLCPNSFSIGNALQTSTNTSATLCLKYYYYSSTPQTFTSSELLQIKGYGSQGSGFDATSNFTVSASISNFTIGGSNNEGEGTQVVFNISSKPGASGSYVLDLLGYVLPTLEQCATEFTLVAGNGAPDYTYIGGCIVVSTSSTSNGTTSNPYPDGELVVQVLGVSGNATG